MEGWLHGLWKLGFIGLEDALALAGDVVDRGALERRLVWQSGLDGWARCGGSEW